MKSVTLFVCCAAALLLCAPPAAATINGSSTASNCGEGGNWIDITFTTDEGVTLVDAWWDWNATGVWLDADGSSLCGPQNQGVTDYDFYFDVPAGTNTQDFGLTATGFDSGDYFRFTMDLDMGGSRLAVHQRLLRRHGDGGVLRRHDPDGHVRHALRRAQRGHGHLHEPGRPRPTWLGPSSPAGRRPWCRGRPTTPPGPSCRRPRP